MAFPCAEQVAVSDGSLRRPDEQSPRAEQVAGRMDMPDRQMIGKRRRRYGKCLCERCG